MFLPTVLSKETVDVLLEAPSLSGFCYLFQPPTCKQESAYSDLKEFWITGDNTSENFLITGNFTLQLCNGRLIDYEESYIWSFIVLRDHLSNMLKCRPTVRPCIDLYSLPNIVRVVKSRRMRWAGHVARMGEDRGVHRVLVGKLNMFRAIISSILRSTRLCLQSVI